MQKENNNEINEAIILAGGNSWRLKPDTETPKPLLPIGKSTLLEYQIKWLLNYKINHIIVATNLDIKLKSAYDEFVEISKEDHRGTGGGVLIASDLMKTKKVYVMNVDDICLYNPLELNFPDSQAKILLSKPKIGFGRVEIRQDLVIRFKEKPILDFYVSTGHYLFKKHIIDQYFPDVGNLEDLVLPKLADERKLNCERLPYGRWYTINTMKDYLEVKDKLEQ